MTISGRKPQAVQRHRHKPTHDWIEVVDEPFTGAPPLPKGQWPKPTLEWWADICTLPHACLWGKGDWRFAIDTARLVAAFHRGDFNRATEIRQRERILGTTADARRDLRIRYVESLPDEEEPGLSVIAEYRRRLGI